MFLVTVAFLYHPSGGLLLRGLQDLRDILAMSEVALVLIQQRHGKSLPSGSPRSTDSVHIFADSVPAGLDISMDWFKGKFTGNHRFSH